MELVCVALSIFMAKSAHFLFFFNWLCNQAILAAKSFGSGLGFEALTRLDWGWGHHFRAPNRLKAPHIALPRLKLSINIINFDFMEVLAKYHHELVFNFLAGLTQKFVQNNILQVVNYFVVHIEGESHDTTLELGKSEFAISKLFKQLSVAVLKRNSEICGFVLNAPSGALLRESFNAIVQNLRFAHHEVEFIAAHVFEIL